jgi:hypothetical protein
MAKAMTTIGSPQGLRFDFRWELDTPSGTASEATRGRLLLWVGEFLAWGRFDGFNYRPILWTWIELLEFLAEAWPYLRYEQGYPLGLQPISPSQLRAAANARWLATPEELARDEDRELFAFEETHDLARGVQGLFTPSVMLSRAGNLVLIGTDKAVLERPATETFEVLEAFALAVLARIEHLTDPRAKQAIQAWNARELNDPLSVAGIATGRSKQDLLALTDNKPQEVLGLLGDNFVMTESIAVVGLTRGILENTTLRPLLERIRAEPQHDTKLLDAASALATEQMTAVMGRKPWDQGYALANWLRGHLGFNAATAVDPEGILVNYGARVDWSDLGSDILDAVACWGPSHGPTIWLNDNSKHKASQGARRVTAAHELCHLLIDRKGALPLAEVVDGNVPKPVEQRANAFAAELLLPRSVALETLAGSKDVESALSDLVRDYVVSREVAARQIFNADRQLPSATLAKLRPYLLDRKQAH